MDTRYRRLVAGIGRPLEPGTYYVGVYNSSTTSTTSYTLESRGIGTGQSVPVNTLDYTAGSVATIANLAPREATYYKVTIPSEHPELGVHARSHPGRDDVGGAAGDDPGF